MKKFQMSNRVIGLLAVIVIVAGIGFYIHADGGGNLLMYHAKHSVPEPKLGNQAQPFAECTEQNGVGVCYESNRFTQSTTTPCSLKSPSGTSTLVSYGLQQTTATSATITWNVATSTTQYATTTRYVVEKNAAAGQLMNVDLGNLVSATTSRLFAPNTYLVAGADAKTGGLNPLSVNGGCDAIFMLVR